MAADDKLLTPPERINLSGWDRLLVSPCTCKVEVWMDLPTA